MRIRILRSIATADRAFTPGSVADIENELARAWIQAGVAEEDKSLDGPPEVKESVPQTDSTTADGTGNADGSKSTSANRRRRRK